MNATIRSFPEGPASPGGHAVFLYEFEGSLPANSGAGEQAIHRKAVRLIGLQPNPENKY